MMNRVISADEALAAGQTPLHAEQLADWHDEQAERADTSTNRFRHEVIAHRLRRTAQAMRGIRAFMRDRAA